MSQQRPKQGDRRLEVLFHDLVTNHYTGNIVDDIGHALRDGYLTEHEASRALTALKVYRQRIERAYPNTANAGHSWEGIFKAANLLHTPEQTLENWKGRSIQARKGPPPTTSAIMMLVANQLEFEQAEYGTHSGIENAIVELYLKDHINDRDKTRVQKAVLNYKKHILDRCSPLTDHLGTSSPLAMILGATKTTSPMADEVAIANDWDDRWYPSESVRFSPAAAKRSADRARLKSAKIKRNQL